MNKERISCKEEAQKALSRGEWKKALESFQRLCADDPDDLRSQLRMGDLLERLGRKKEAVGAYRTVAEAYAEKGFFQQAISVYKILLRIEPSRDDARERLDRLGRQKDLEEAFSGALVRFPLFSELHQKELQSLLAHVKVVPFAKDSFLCREGEQGDSLCVIRRGEIEISKGTQKGDEIRIRRLKEGDIFGEFGFFTDRKRHATLRALTECEILEIPRTGLEEVMKTYPRLKQVLEDLFRERILDTFLALSPLFSSLRAEQRDEVLKRFALRKVPKETILFQKGDPPTSLYMIKSGEVEISIRNRGGKKILLEVQRSGNFFGEISLLLDKPRMIDARTLQPSELLELTKADFQSCLRQLPELRTAVKGMTSMRLSRIKAALSQDGIERAKEAMV